MTPALILQMYRNMRRAGITRARAHRLALDVLTHSGGIRTW